MNPSQIPEPDTLDPQLRSVIGNMGAPGSWVRVMDSFETVGAGDSGDAGRHRKWREAGARGEPADLLPATRQGSPWQRQGQMG